MTTSWLEALDEVIEDSPASVLERTDARTEVKCFTMPERVGDKEDVKDVSTPLHIPRMITPAHPIREIFKALADVSTSAIAPVKVTHRTRSTYAAVNKTRSVILGSTRSEIVIEPVQQPIDHRSKEREPPWELVGHSGSRGKQHGNNRGHYKTEKSNNCVRCGKPNAFLILSKPHIDALNEYVEKGTIMAEVIANVKEGFHCTTCLASMSPKCTTCGVGPRIIVKNGFHPFGLHCQECKRKHQQSIEKVKEMEEE